MRYCGINFVPAMDGKLWVPMPEAIPVNFIPFSVRNGYVTVDGRVTPKGRRTIKCDPLPKDYIANLKAMYAPLPYLAGHPSCPSIPIPLDKTERQIRKHGRWLSDQTMHVPYDLRSDFEITDEEFGTKWEWAS